MINIEQELFALLPKGVTEIMPNHCHNRVTVYGSGDESRAHIAKIKSIFADEAIFTHFIPEPDWANLPLMFKEETVSKGIGNKIGNLGELPVNGRFQSTDRQDDRWYDWRIQNWDTKWDAYDIEFTDDDPDSLEVTFNTAWSPPEAICRAMRELYPNLSVSWFYDEPGCEIAGYL